MWLLAAGTLMVAARAPSLLSVTDSDTAAGMGGMIRFLVARARLLAAAANVAGAP